MVYRSLSSYFKEKYQKKIKKICIDGGFTCPNRDGKCSTGGCIFCGGRGAGEHIAEDISVTEQVRAFFEKPTAADGYIAYFQNFTNTYAPIPVLKKRYDDALIDDRIIILSVGTRPDCITEEIADLLASYKNRVDVFCELGLQTASDKTAELINRGYETEVYERAVNILASRGIEVVTHIMIGLPGEGDMELRETVELINRLPVSGIKIHSVYVMEGTRLAEMYRRGEYTPISREDYINRAVWALSHLRTEIVVHRVTGDCPEGLLVAPEWNREKNAVIEEIRKRLALL